MAKILKKKIAKGAVRTIKLEMERSSVLVCRALGIHMNREHGTVSSWGIPSVSVPLVFSFFV